MQESLGAYGNPGEDRLWRDGDGLSRPAQRERGDRGSESHAQGQVTEDEAFIRRFRREASIAQSISSPHLVKIVDSGLDNDRPFIAMEFVEGESLHHLLRRNGPLPYHQAVDIAMQVASGLSVAHRKGGRSPGHISPEHTDHSRRRCQARRLRDRAFPAVGDANECWRLRRQAFVLRTRDI